MRYKVIISPKALSDIMEGAEYYEKQQKGLGKRFRGVIRNVINDIRKMPQSASTAFDNVRYKVVAKFPYVIFYEVEEGTIYVARIFNTHQKPFN